MDVGRRGGVDGDLEHSAGGRLTQVYSLPGLSNVAATEQGPGLLGTLGCSAAAGAGRQVHGLGVVGSHQQPTAIGAAGEHLVNLHMLPVVPPVPATEHGHLGNDVHRPSSRGADRHTVQVQGVVAQVGTVDQRLPALAAVPAAQQAANFDSSVHVRRIARVQGQADDPFGQGRHICSEVRKHHPVRVHFAPGLTRVLGTVNAARLVARINRFRVLGMHGQGPHVHALPRLLQGFPMVSPVVASINPLLGAGVNDAGIFRMDLQGPDLRVGR